MGLALQETLTGKIEEEKKNPKMTHGKSYIISVSPSIKHYGEKKKKIINPTLINKSADDFKIEDQYESRAAVKRVVYKNQWHPIFCQSATLANLKGNLILIGGVSSVIARQVTMIPKNDNDFNWKVIKDDKETVLQRYGHTCCEYGDSLIIFGGQRGASSKKAKRIVLNDLWIYKPFENSLESILVKSCPDLRYGHCACIAGNLLVVYGGMNEVGAVLKDFGIFDLNENWWIKIEMSPQNTRKDTPPGIWFTDIAPVFYKGRKDNNKDFHGKYHINKNIDPFMPKHLREIAQDQEIVLEGCYMFGGITEENEITNDLYILKILEGGHTFEWEKVEEYNGLAPLARCHHFMAFLEFNNSIVVYGGRNDNKSKSSVLNDVFFLQVDTLTWINVDFKNKKKPSSRFSHACAIEGSKMIIFGGVGSKFGMEQSIEVIHFDPEDLNRNFTNILK